MRLHRLEIRAFGPFADTEEIDFDAVTRSGLFLLHGPTGSGKTSVLDAVCFALYGAVPGARAGAGRLRSDHAAPDLAPKVTCEFSIGPRRFEVVRSPAWERPKRRGEGVTTEPAKVTVREQVDGSWIARTTRPDETAHLLNGVLGMGHDQFTKLVLLPQGEFAAFLRADAETRRVMLEKLFDTDRFSAVQQWLREAAGRLRHRVEEDRTVTRELLARADQAVSALPGDVPDPSDPPDDEPSSRDHLARHLALAVHARKEATSRRTVTAAGLARARQAHTAGVDLARRQADHARLTASALCLDAGAFVQEENRLRVRNAERALGVAPVAPELHDAEQALEAARADLAHAVAEAADDVRALGGNGPGGNGPGGDDAALASASAALRERTGLLRGIAAEAERLPQVEAHRCELAKEADRERRVLADAVTASASFGPALAVTLERLTRARVLAAGLPSASEALRAAEAVSAAVDDRERLTAEDAAAEPRRALARSERDSARQEWLDLRERRLAQMAAELAEGLSAGGPCPVCGATEHPVPARPAPDQVTEAQESKARSVYEQADAGLAEQERAARERAEVLARVCGVASGLDAATAAARREAAREAAEEARAARDALEELEAEAARLEDSVATADGVVEEARTRVRSREDDLAAATAARDELEARVAKGRGRDSSPAARADRLEASARRLEAVLDARRTLSDASRAAASARRTALAAAREAGFGGLAEALGAVLPDEDRGELAERVRAYDSELAAVTARLAEEALVSAAALPAPDVARLAAEEAQSAGDDEAAAALVALAEEAVGQLREIDATLSAHLRAAEPRERQHRTVADLTRCADGTGGGNTLRMSLSAYVLAARLEEVASAASLRLSSMSGGRYSLQHTDETKGQRRSGLGLQVVDAWTGRHRDTASLSGGESFYASLALALGLADVVTAEAGGTAVETLFVDEGFGSLDDDTLDEVMDVLDGLRSGGRAVGLVSHVADLRQRIPTQIEVVKGRNGSHLVAVEG